MVLKDNWHCTVFAEKFKAKINTAVFQLKKIIFFVVYLS